MPTTKQLEEELKKEKSRRRALNTLLRTLGVLVVVAAISVLIATLFLPILRIYGSSMTPTLTEGDLVISVKETKYEKGDIYAFYYQSNVLVKRLIGVAGDWIDIDDEGNVYVNGELIDEPYLFPEDGEKSYKSLGITSIEFPYQVPEGRLFFLGDHRETSVDSRTSELGCIDEEYIVGRIVFRIWPLSAIGVIK